MRSLIQRQVESGRRMLFNFVSTLLGIIISNPKLKSMRIVWRIVTKASSVNLFFLCVNWQGSNVGGSFWMM